MPYNKAEATQTIKVTGLYAFPWLKILAPIIFGTLLIAAPFKK
jgi:hypothetical protein